MESIWMHIIWCILYIYKSCRWSVMKNFITFSTPVHGAGDLERLSSTSGRKGLIIYESNEEDDSTRRRALAIFFQIANGRFHLNRSGIFQISQKAPQEISKTVKPRLNCSSAFVACGSSLNGDEGSCRKHRTYSNGDELGRCRTLSDWIWLKSYVKLEIVKKLNSYIFNMDTTTAARESTTSAIKSPIFATFHTVLVEYHAFAFPRWVSIRHSLSKCRLLIICLSELSI